MKQMQFDFSSAVAAGLVFGSLGMSILVGSVTTMADDRGGASPTPIEKNVAQENSISLPAPAATQNDGNSPSQAMAARTSQLASKQVLGAHLSKDGMLTGRLNVSDSISGAHVAAESLSVRFVQRGSVVARAKPGPGGVLQVEGLSPGAYSMIASGADGFFMSALIVHPFEKSTDAEAANAAAEPFQIDATVVHPSNVALVRKLMQKLPSVRLANSSVKKKPKQVAQVGRRVEEVDSFPAPILTPIFRIGNDGRATVNVNVVNSATGEMTVASSATAYMLQRGAVRGEYQIDQDGSLNAKNLVPGQYSCVVVAHGTNPAFAALGVIVEKEGNNSGTVSTSSRLAVKPVRDLKRQDVPPTINTVPLSDNTQTQDPGNDQNPPPGAMFGGTGGGGGGGFGGGGGGGALGFLALGAGAAGLAAGLAAANNNNNNNTPASPASP